MPDINFYKGLETITPCFEGSPSMAEKCHATPAPALQWTSIHADTDVTVESEGRGSKKKTDCMAKRC